MESVWSKAAGIPARPSLPGKGMAWIPTAYFPKRGGAEAAVSQAEAPAAQKDPEGGGHA